MNDWRLCIISGDKRATGTDVLKGPGRICLKSCQETEGRAEWSILHVTCKHTELTVAIFYWLMGLVTGILNTSLSVQSSGNHSLLLIFCYSFCCHRRFPIITTSLHLANIQAYVIAEL